MAADPGTHACVVAGTGSVICSRVGERFVKSGGRGYLLGDFGSAFRLGQASAQEFVWSGKDAVSPELRHAIEDRFETLDEATVVAKLYRSVSPVAQLAKLATAFARDYESGATYAQAALHEQFSRLAAETRRHVATHFPGESEWHIALTGGVWEMSGSFQSVFQNSLSALGGSYRFSRPRVAPIRGAARLAKETYYGN
jgi:N-acetylglucosamine kinase-like BadF-type ATPase